MKSDKIIKTILEELGKSITPHLENLESRVRDLEQNSKPKENPQGNKPGMQMDSEFILDGKARWISVPEREVQKMMWEEVGEVMKKYKVIAMSVDLIKKF